MQDFLALLQSPELSKAITNILAVLAALGIGIEFTPFIKFNPISWAMKKLGKALNHETLEAMKDLRKKMDTLDKDFTQKQICDGISLILPIRAATIISTRKKNSIMC